MTPERARLEIDSIDGLVPWGWCARGASRSTTPERARRVCARLGGVTTAKLTAIHVAGRPVPLAHGPVAISAGDRIAIERGAVVVRHGKRHRATARVPLGAGAPVVLNVDTPGGPLANMPPAVRVEV